MTEWYGCKSCGYSVTCVLRDDPAWQKQIKENGGCPHRIYRINVNMRSTFR